MTRPTQSRLRELLRYDPETGLLYWNERVDALGRRHGVSGKIAGHINAESGYVYVCVDYHQLFAHILIWFIQTGVWPENGVDHENRNPTDNRWLNLREATRTQNAQNKKFSGSISGFKGVSFDSKTGNPFARIRVLGKLIQIGTFNTPEQAAIAYDTAAVFYFGEFAATNKMLGLL